MDEPRLAILGATGHVGRALAAGLAPGHRLTLYARRPDVARAFAATLGAHAPEVLDLAELVDREHDALVNCLGVGDPAGASDPAVFDEVSRYGDDVALGYLECHPDALLVNMSSGAAYCSAFTEPALGGELTHAAECDAGDAYGRAKRASELRHRARGDAAIVDLRLFGFLSRYMDLDATYLMADVARSLRSGEPMLTGPDDVTRDYVAPYDLAALVSACMAAGRLNTAYDVYSAAPVRKFQILDAFVERFGLTYSVVEVGSRTWVGEKPAYYSLDRRAREIGYEPTRTSLEALEEETAELLKTMGRA